MNLGRMDLDTSILHGPVQLYLAQRLTCTAAAQEGTETIQPVRLPWQEAVRRVMASAITHGPSCVLLLKAQYAGAVSAGGPGGSAREGPKGTAPAGA
jgi:hypothetical protein